MLAPVHPCPAPLAEWARSVYGRQEKRDGESWFSASFSYNSLCEKDAIVWIPDIRGDAGEEKAAAFRAEGWKVYSVQMDVGVEAEWKRAIDTVFAQCGRQDSVVNLAAINIRKSVLYLASEEGSFINGCALTVDGGTTCY